MAAKKRTQIGGTTRPGDIEPGTHFGARMKEVREKRGWSVAQLAARLAQLGSTLQRSTLAKIEGAEPARSRRVTLEEVLLISYALDVSPLHMIVPPTDLVEPRLIVAHGLQPVEPSDARAWLRGEEELIGQDRATFALERPASLIPEALERAPDVARQLQKSWRPRAATTEEKED